MSAGEQSTTALIKSLSNELKKEYYEFDGDGNLYKLYQARRNAIAGDPALVTKYIYTGPLTRVILQTHEYPGLWPSITEVVED